MHFDALLHNTVNRPLHHDWDRHRPVYWRWHWRGGPRDLQVGAAAAAEAEHRVKRGPSKGWGTDCICDGVHI